MDHSELQKKLLAAARACPPSERVPFAFEKRILARLQGTRSRDLTALWGRALWRAAAACAGVAMILGAWSWANPAPAQPDLTQDFENTVLALADQDASVDLTR